MSKSVNSILSPCVIAMICLMHVQPLSSQIIDDKSIYVYVEGNIVDTIKLEEIKANKIQRLKIENAKRREILTKEIVLLQKLIAVAADNGKVADNQLYEYAIKIFGEYEVDREIITSKSNKYWTFSNDKNDAIRLLMQEDNTVSVSDILRSALSEQSSKRTNEDIVRKKLKKKKISELFLPYLLAKFNEQKKELTKINTEDPVPIIYNEEIPYKKGLIKIKNPNNRIYCFVHDKARLDSIDLKMQLFGWEWWIKEKSEEMYTTVPFSFRYRRYKSHPDYRIIQDKVFNKNGDLICQTNLLRSDEDIIRGLKEKILNTIYILDYKSNKYDILKAPARTQEAVRNMLGLPFKSSVDAKTAKKNQKIVNDYFKTQLDEVMVSNGIWQQRANARARANNAESKMGALLLSGLFDKNFNAALSFKQKLEEDHKNDLYSIYKISRVNNTSFKVIFMNNKNETSYTGLVTIHQKGPYAWSYSYKLIPNEEKIVITPN